MKQKQLSVANLRKKKEVDDRKESVRSTDSLLLPPPSLSLGAARQRRLLVPFVVHLSERGNLGTKRSRRGGVHVCVCVVCATIIRTHNASKTQLPPSNEAFGG